MSFNIGDKVLVKGHSLYWDGTEGIIKTISTTLTRTVVITITKQGPKLLGTHVGFSAEFREDVLELISSNKPQMITMFKSGIAIGDVVEVFDYKIGTGAAIWNGTTGTLHIIDGTSVFIHASAPVFYGTMQMCKKGDSLGFPIECVRLIKTSIKAPQLESSTQLRFKSSGNHIKIIESKGDQVRFIIIESGYESDWYTKSELEKECM